ncbi:Protein CBG12926 [Caenorhabditis briggsae]|uniref:Uncharacterized protein n=3 Tax=Caenorhabditis briggsae TaxID=6238 RepID=A0AAE9D253_CAEBR|nr:Protein CBG12926 [Caenorhabditis briggsae]ULT92515.1 hypothetical protein L3Y34_009956 [Caenorhabditis briggsae]CAP31820.2 Protein CBG12926 [Caenorhabditis briggsae]
MTAMRFFAIFLAFSPILGVFAAFEDPEFFEIKIDREHPEAVYKAFKEFKIKYNRKYKDASETQMRFNQFVKSYNKVNDLNAKAKESGYDTKFGINKFADLTEGEFSGRLSHVVPNNTGVPVLDLEKPFFRQAVVNKTRHKRRSTKYPDYFDLRKTLVNGESIIGPIKDQGNCACCWGFAIAGLVESVNALHSNRFRSLSDQELCDCGTNGTPGCKGGSLQNGVDYVNRYGLSADDDYPYDDTRAFTSKRCRVRETRRVVKERTFTYAAVNARKAEQQIMEVLTKWNVPVAVYFKVGDRFKSYEQGVIVEDDCRGAKDWHAGLIVGYDSISNSRGREYPYWIVKNSWGNWAEEDGYFRVIRGENWCSIESNGYAGDMKSHDDYYYYS